MAAEIKVEHDTQICAHYPVRLKVGGSLSQDMGQRIKRPMAFQGLTRKEARTKDPPAGDCRTIEDTLYEARSRWNREPENYRAKLEDKVDKEYKGRGQKPTCVKNTISAPQDNSEGYAITEEMRQ
eukprot:13000773-Heterocapsa_arctica.AAC.1